MEINLKQYLSVGPLTSKLGEGDSGNVQHSLFHKHWWDSEWLFLLHFALCSLFTLPFHNISILFPIFLLDLSQVTPTPTLKACHRQDRKSLEGTRKLWVSARTLATALQSEWMLNLGECSSWEPSRLGSLHEYASNEQRQEESRRHITTSAPAPFTDPRSTSCSRVQPSLFPNYLEYLLDQEKKKNIWVIPRGQSLHLLPTTYTPSPGSFPVPKGK